MAMTVRAPTHIIPLWTIAGVGLEVGPSEIEATSDAEFSWTVDARPSWYPPHSIFQKRKGGLNYKFVNSAWTVDDHVHRLQPSSCCPQRRRLYSK